MARSDQAPLNHSALIGAYLAVNAISDAYMLVDSTDCSLYKAQYIHGRHDWNSTLLRCDGRHRISFSNVCVQGAVQNHERPLRARVNAIADIPGVGAIFVAAMPLCSLTCVDYGRMLRETRGLSLPSFEVPAESLSGDWLDGYATLLETIARRADFAPARKTPGSVALIGHMMDRNEGDQRGNLEEIERLLGLLGLSVASTWLDGGAYSSLAEAMRAELIVSLPYARAAARAVAARGGAPLVETCLPFGMESTERFLRDVASAAGRVKECEVAIAQERRRVTRGLRWLLPHLFVGRRAAFVGDPHLAAGFAQIAADLGLRMSGYVVTGRRRHAEVSAGDGVPVLYEPGAASEELLRLLSRPADVLVGATIPMGELYDEGVPVVEVGFPSYWQHALSRRPYLGYEGFLSVVDRMADALAGRIRASSVERITAKSARLA